MELARRFSLLWIGLVVFVLAALGAHSIRRSTAQSRLDQPAASSRTAVDSVGHELLLVLIASVDCPVCHDPVLPELMENARRDIMKQANDIGARFAFIGVVEGSDPNSGVDYLSRFRSVDEIIAGHGWLNTGLVQFVTTVHEGPLVTPQVLVVGRTTRFYAVDRGSERVLVRHLGLGSLSVWAEAGAPLGDLSQFSTAASRSDAHSLSVGGNR